MNLLLDTNILLDIALKRQPFVEQAAQVLSTAQHRKFPLYMTATTITDLFYIVRKAKGKDIALAFIEDLLQYVDVAAVDKWVILRALKLGLADFEDAVQVGAAEKAGIDVIITRNEPDFQNVAIRVLNLGQFLQQYPNTPATSEKNSQDKTSSL
ncbi:MAG: PIN domain-containing protein [Desulfotignum sp.]|nr:PIN domain-containing protein [Desulfotignum sp.]MCF8087923.1 PIN domain-containing protein [Desulfotignum sp.]MCF8136118.1 PIN domain-containing protein [Desulfotignum sp.]